MGFITPLVPFAERWIIQMKHITSYKNKKSPKIRHFLPINITVASRAKNKIPETLVNKGPLGFCSLFKLGSAAAKLNGID